MSENLYLTARLKVQDGKAEELKKAALAIVEPSRAEEGCVSYNVHQSLEDETVFIWRESWKSKAALDEHFEKDYFKTFFAIANEIATKPPEIILSKKIS